MVLQKQILIVEDNELNRMMLCEILSNEYSVLEAGNGQEALDILKQHNDSISLILLDVIMPVMDGYTFLDKIKNDAELALIPVIVMTQGDSEEDEIAALAHGATDFVPKPYRPRVIMHRVASIIKLRETAALVNQFQYDRLTGLYSKEFFYQQVHERIIENPDRNYCIACSNIENFKLYNDNFGRKAGDRLLQNVADSVGNILGEMGISGRYGADRFMFLLESSHDSDEIEEFISKTQFNRSNDIKKVSITWGIYEISDRSVPVEQMCDRALLAADSIKGQYNQHYAVYDDALRSKLLQEKAITDAMETALSEGQFTVYLQPKYCLNDNCMSGAEALVRWIHPVHGFMSPGEFIPLFEKNGFIPQLDQYVWEQVCMILHEWRQKGYPPVAVSVNVSRSDVYQSHLVDTLLGLVRKYDIEPAYLHLEITESAYTDNPDQIISTVKELRRLGFIIEMDDFGSGYSSLNMLSQMDLDILKLDMKFIRNEMNKPAEQSILNDIISMAHRMHLSVVAEGVETRDQMKRLQAVGCDYVQGYFFAKPMPVTEFEELLNSQNHHRLNISPNTSHGDAVIRRLLIVDEDAEYRSKVRQTLEAQYHIVESTNPHDAITRISSGEYERVSAVILSMTFPQEDIALFLKALRQDPAFWNIPVLATIPNGDVMPDMPMALEADDFLCKRHPVFDLHRRIDRLMYLVTSRQRENALQDEANRDYLTGLLNRRGLNSATSSLRNEDLPLAIFIFDLDDLKKVNDTCGHDMGDQLIQSFADLLRRNTRQGDILCRYGGDEFIIILKNINDSEAVIRKGDTICNSFRECFVDEQIAAACTGGICICGTNENPSVEFIEYADRALYLAKKEKKGSCCLWRND